MSCVSALARTLRAMTEPRRLAILTEGQFGAHHAKTAMGVIRYGRDRLVAVLDSSIAGRNVSEWLPGHDIPAVGTLDEALALPDAAGHAADRHRADRRQASAGVADDDPGGDRRRPRRPLRPAHVPRRRPRVRRRGRRARDVRIVDYRRPPERHETAVGRPHGAGKRVILTVGTDCAIGKMSVALELRKSALEAGDRRVVRPDRPDRDDDRGLGRGGRPASSATSSQGTVEWMVEQAEELGDWIIVEGQGSLDHPAYSSVTLGAHPRRDAAGDGDGPQAGPRRATTSTISRRRRSRSPKLPEFIELHERWPASSLPRRSSRSRSTRRSTATTPMLAGSSRRSPSQTGLADRRPVPVRGGPALAGDPRSGRRACRGSTRA